MQSSQYVEFFVKAVKFVYKLMETRAMKNIGAEFKSKVH